MKQIAEKNGGAAAGTSNPTYEEMDTGKGTCPSAIQDTMSRETCQRGDEPVTKDASYEVTLVRAPDLSQSEIARRISQAYEIILNAGRTRIAAQAALDGGAIDPARSQDAKAVACNVSGGTK